MNRIEELLPITRKDKERLARSLHVELELVEKWCSNKEQPSINQLFEISYALEVCAGDIWVGRC